MKVQVPQTSMTLIERVKEGDAEAWHRFVDVYSELVYSQCVFARLNAVDAYEVTSDVFVSLVRSMRSFEKRKSSDYFHHFLRHVTSCRISDHWNARKRILDNGRGGTPNPFQDLDIVDDGGLSEEQIDLIWSDQELLSGIRIRVLREARENFDDKMFIAYHQLKVENLPVTSVATELNLTLVEAERKAERVAAWILKRTREFPDVVETQADRILSEEEYAILEFLQDAFEVSSIDVYRLKVILEMPVPLVAQELKMTPRAVSTAASRVKKWLRENAPQLIRDSHLKNLNDD